MTFGGAAGTIYMGLPIEEKELEQMVAETQKAHGELPELLLSVFSQVVESVGIEVRDERTD